MEKVNVMIARTVLILLSSLPMAAMAGKPVIAGYYLTGPSDVTGGDRYATLENLESLASNVTDRGTNFNRLILSFVQPSLAYYRPEANSLQCTGLFGLHCNSQPDDSTYDTESFYRLKAAISTLKAGGVETYLSVGGAAYSCSPEYYDITVGAKDSCGPADKEYDTFPNPLDNPPRFDNTYSPEQARASYTKLVQMASNLGASGIDVDYEEAWHADINAYEWRITPDNVEPSPGITYMTTEELLTQGQGDQVYDDDHNLVIAGTTRTMPDTVDKFAAILREIDANIDAANADLKISIAVPAVGAIPTMSANWGTNAQTVSTYGGAWYGGNLYGLIYNTALLYPNELETVDFIGAMTYDLSSTDCGAANGTFIPCALDQQVRFYWGTFLSWLRTGAYALLPDDTISSPEHALVKGAPNYAQSSIQPKKVQVTADFAIGLLSGRPGWGDMIMDHNQLSEILNSAKNTGSNSIILWDLFKDVRFDESNGGWDDNWPRPTEVLKESCKVMKLASASHKKYKCNADVLETKPGAANNQSKT